MASLLIYNPENDTALAAGKRFFTPAKEPRRLAADGSFLPMWWAEKGDFILTERENLPEMLNMRNRFSLSGDLFQPSDIKDISNIKPWGWSDYIKEKCLKLGLKEEILPSDIQLETWRRFSHRKTTVEVHKRLKTESSLCPKEVFTLGDTMKLIETMNGDAVIKQPWSSSGRGVFYSKNMSRRQLETVIAGFINKQGSVLIEKRRDRLKDFALLYYCSETEVAFKGISYFITSSTGEYAGNLVDKNAVLIDRIGHDITNIAERLRLALQSIFLPSYQGWLGVDMMVERLKDGKESIVPCVEINVRMTMGVVAHFIADSHPELCGRTLTLTKNIPDVDEINLSPVKDSHYHYVLTSKLF